MSRVHWVELRPRDPATAGLVTLRFAGGARDRSYFREENGQHYKAGLVAAPRFAARIGYGRDGFTGQTIPQASRIQIAPAQADVFESLAGYFWKDAEITIDAGPENASTFPRLFTGTVVGDSIADGVFSFTIADLSTRLDKPVCTKRFAGNGGIEGGEEAEGRTKRRSWGYVFNVEGRLLDPANSIYEFGDPAFPLSSFSALRDKGRGGPFTVLAWQGSIAATFAALQASTPAQGGGVVAPSIACAKWWTEPSGPLTADFVGTPGTGGSMSTAALIDAISASFSGPGVTGRAAAIALRPATAGIHVGDETTTGAQLIDRLALGSSLIWVAAPEGVIRLFPWSFSSSGGAPVLQGQFIGRERAYAPHYRRRIGFQANNRRHSESEIAESIRYDDGVLAEDLRPAEPDATKGAIIPTPGTSAPGNVVDENGVVRNPGELLNSEIRLDPAGRLTYRPLPDVPPVELGQITLPDIGAVSEAAMRRAEDDIDQLGRALATALDEVSGTRATFRDAGFYADPATGQVRIHAIEQTKERVNTAEIRLSAAEASIRLRATTSYVNEQIALAAFDPSQVAELTDIFLRLGAAEVDIDGLNATVSTLATVTELSLVQGRVTTAEEAIDALEGTITTKVDTTTFDLLATRVSNAETVLTAIGDTASIVNAVSATRLIEKAQDSNAEANLRALLLGDKVKREQVAAVAAARQELTARIIDGDAAEAAFRLALQVRVGATEAAVATESIARASADSALATQITSLTASTTTSLNSLATSIANESSARGTAINNEADARIAAIQAEANARGTALTAEQQARINAINAERAQTLADVAAERAARENAVSTLNAAITSEQTARTNADTALATDITNLSASLTSNVATLQTNISNANQARIDGDGALAASISSLSAELDTEVSNRAAAVESEAQARVAADGLIAAGLAQQVTAGRVVEGLASDLADQLLGALLANDKNRREVNGAVAAARQEITAQVVSATEAFATSILALVARIANNEASFISEQIARVAADESIVASVEQLESQFETDTATLNAAIINEQIARTNAVQSLATSITNLNASFTGQLSAEATARTNAIAAEATTRAAAISAESTARTNSVNTLTSGLNSALGRLTDEELARLQGDQAEATARAAALTAEANARTTAINNEANARIAAIQAEATARGTALTAEENARIAAINAERQQTLADVAAERQARESAVTTLTASISNEAIARANGDGALAGQISTLNTTVGNQSATLTQFASSISGLQNRWGVKFDNNGRVTGFVLNGSNQEANADFVIDRFRLIHPTSGFVYFQATQNGVLMSNVEVDTLKAGIVSASRMSAAAMGETAFTYIEPGINTNGFNWVNVVSVSMTPVNGRPTKLMFSALIRDVTDANTIIKVRIIRDDGAIIYGESARRTGAHLNITDEGVPVCIPIVDTVAAGRATTWTLQMAKVNEQNVICEASFRFAQAEELSRVNTQSSNITLGGGTGGEPGPGVPITNPPGGSNPIP